MIFITGDTHGDYDDLLSRMKGAGIKKGDTAIVCGDFGFVWGDPQSDYLLNMLVKEDYTILFIDGNHENFDKLYSYPVVDFSGGKAHKIYDNVLHLMRGEAYVIEGKSFFTFGGAASIDRKFRQEGVSWWSREIPNDEEFFHALDTLELHDYKFDYILTHTIPDAFIHSVCEKKFGEDARLTQFLDEIYLRADFKKWFSGHFHTDTQYSDRLVGLYHDVVKI